MKQRIVGALVLIALGVIFLPVLFNLQPPRPLDETTQIPAAPDIEPVEIIEPIKPERDSEVPPEKPGEEPAEESPAIVQNSLAAEQPLIEEVDNSDLSYPEREPAKLSANEIKSQPKDAPKLTESGLPESWIIQVASYRQKPSASQEVIKLQKKGYKAFFRQSVVGGAAVYRVYVGPFILRRSAEEEKALIDRSLKVKSLILPFEP